MRNLQNVFVAESEIKEKDRIKIPTIQSSYLLHGEIRTWEGPYKEVYSPIYVEKDGQLDNYMGAFPSMGPKEAIEAINSAAAAFDHGKGAWPNMTIEERIACVKKFVVMMKAQREQIVKLIMWEIGKKRSDSEKEFDRTVDYINDTIEAVKNLDRDSSRFTISEGIIAQIRRTPLGVVLCMGPFNYPLNETYTTLIPALIMGNTVVFKPPRMGILLHEPLLRAFAEAFPKGVVNTVYGSGATVIGPLMESGKVNVLAFIGSSKTADILKKAHPQLHRLKSVLGLDAKNPAIVLADADIDAAVKECVLGTLSFNGQRCTALKILFVHESIANEFIEKIAAAVEKLSIGLPWEEGMDITPLPETGKPEYLTKLIENALAYGAKLENPHGGQTKLSLFYPAVLSGVNDQMDIYNEEQFGPIIPIVTYKEIEEPLQYVINSNYGQQASVFGKNADQIATLIDTLVNQVCRVNINSQCQRGPDTFPFTGRKDSAEGTLSVTDALRVFSIRTLVAAKSNEINQQIITEIIKDDKSKFLNTDFIF